MFESTNYAKILVLLQVHETKGGRFNNNSSEQLTSSDIDEINKKWKEICQKIQVDLTWTRRKNNNFKRS
jgi:hypothetical protein